MSGTVRTGLLREIQEGTVLSEEKATKNIRITAVILAVIAAAAGLFFKDPGIFALGILFGLLIAELLFWQNEKSIEKMLREPDGAEKTGRRDYFLRMLIRGATLLIAYLNPYTSLTGTVLGLVTIPAAIYLLAAISGLQTKKKPGKASADSGKGEQE